MNVGILCHTLMSNKLKTTAEKKDKMNSYHILFAIVLTKYVLMAMAGTLKEQTGKLNATFPCGDPEYGQRCKIPFEYCDIIIESCMPCNVDICREKSRPSCNIFCDDTTTEIKKNYKNDFHITLGVLILIVVLDIVVVSITMVIQRRKRNNLEDLPDQRDMRPIANPTD